MLLLRLSAHITVSITIALICTKHMLSDSVYFLTSCIHIFNTVLSNNILHLMHDTFNVTSYSYHSQCHMQQSLTHSLLRLSSCQFLHREKLYKRTIRIQCQSDTHTSVNIGTDKITNQSKGIQHGYNPSLF